MLSAEPLGRVEAAAEPQGPYGETAAALLLLPSARRREVAVSFGAKGEREQSFLEWAPEGLLLCGRVLKAAAGAPAPRGRRRQEARARASPRGRRGAAWPAAE